MTHRQKINIVWFKRDLRLTDHMLLKLAERSGFPTLLLYIFEPILVEDPHYSERYWRFVTQAITDMNRSLSAKVTVAHGEAITALKEIRSRFEIDTIFSHKVKPDFCRGSLSLSNIINSYDLETYKNLIP